MAPKREKTAFGANLRLLREKAGITYAQLAEKSGVYANTLARLERREQEPSWPIVVRIAAALGVPTDAFLAKPPKLRARGRGRPANS